MHPTTENDLTPSFTTRMVIRVVRDSTLPSEKQPFSPSRSRGFKQSRTNEQTQLLSLVCNCPIHRQATKGDVPWTCWCSGLHGRLQASGGWGGREEEGRKGGIGRVPRSAVMTAVLREKRGLKPVPPDIERVSDTLTIPDPGCHTSAPRFRTGTRNGDGVCAATDNDVRGLAPFRCNQLEQMTLCHVSQYLNSLMTLKHVHGFQNKESDVYFQRFMNSDNTETFGFFQAR